MSDVDGAIASPLSNNHHAVIVNNNTMSDVDKAIAASLGLSTDNNDINNNTGDSPMSDVERAIALSLTTTATSTIAPTIEETQMAIAMSQSLERNGGFPFFAVFVWAICFQKNVSLNVFLCLSNKRI